MIKSLLGERREPPTLTHTHTLSHYKVTVQENIKVSVCARVYVGQSVKRSPHPRYEPKQFSICCPLVCLSLTQTNAMATTLIETKRQ